MIILPEEELCQISGTCVAKQGMNIKTAGEKKLYSMGMQFV